MLKSQISLNRRDLIIRGAENAEFVILVLVYETSSDSFGVVLGITHRKSEKLVLVVIEKYLDRCMAKMVGVVTKMVDVFTDNLFLRQIIYLTKMLKRFNMINCKIVTSSMKSKLINNILLFSFDYKIDVDILY